MIEQADRVQAQEHHPTVRRDGESIVIEIPMIFRRRSKRKEIVLPPGAATSAPPRPPSPLALALARAFRWQEMTESSEVKSISDLARRLKLDPSFVANTIRLAQVTQFERFRPVLGPGIARGGPAARGGGEKSM
jgi:hypothetical protein